MFELEADGSLVRVRPRTPAVNGESGFVRELVFEPAASFEIYRNGFVAPIQYNPVTGAWDSLITAHGHPRHHR